MLLDGLHIPLTTPFYPDGRIYLRKLEHNAERYSRTPAAGLAVMTRVGEGSLLSDEEARQVLTTAIEASAAEKVMTADVSRDSVAGTLDLAESAAAAGYDVVAVRVPRVLDGGDEKATLTYFQAVADRSPLPLVVEDAGALTVEATVALAGHPGILGVIGGSSEAGHVAEIAERTAGISREVPVTMVFAAVTGRMLRVQAATVTGGSYIDAGTLGGGGTALATAPPKPAIRTRTKRVGFQRLVASTGDLLNGLRGGAVGAMLPMSASAPQAVYEVLAAYKDGDLGLAAEKQSRLLQAVDLLEKRLGVAGLKAGADLNGYYGGKPRLPLLPLSAAEREAVEDAMRGLRS